MLCISPGSRHEFTRSTGLRETSRDQAGRPKWQEAEARRDQLVRSVRAPAPPIVLRVKHMSLNSNQRQGWRAGTAAGFARPVRTRRSTVVVRFLMSGIGGMHSCEFHITHRDVNAMPIPCCRTRASRDQDDPDENEGQRVNHGFEHGSQLSRDLLPSRCAKPKTAQP